MRVALIYSLEGIVSTAKPLVSWGSMNFGISYLSAVLKTQGHETRLLVLGSDHERENEPLLRAWMADFDPRVVGFTAVASQYPFIARTAEFIKQQWPEKFCLIGGVHATLNPAEVMAGPFDGLCVGEGEHPFSELCRQLEQGQTPHGIANLWLKTSPRAVEKNPTRPFLRDLDSLPFPDREMWRSWIEERRGYTLALNLGRGCPYPCTYCCNHALKKTASGAYVRKRSADNIIREIGEILRVFPGREIMHFEVESIALDKAWLLGFCEQLRHFNQSVGNAVSYSCNFRVAPNSADEAIFAALRQANILRLNIGLESGSERVRNEVLNRHYTNREFLKVVNLAKKYGLAVRLFNMVGLPGETRQEHLETVRMNRECQPEEHYTVIFYPYAGTELHRVCLEQGLAGKNIRTENERREAVVSTHAFTKAQIRRSLIWFDFRVYLGKRPLWWVLLRTLYNWTSQYPLLTLGIRLVSQWRILKFIHARIKVRS
jgi:radical SAM superfamily enzyme YgiQ (UPF0313 family)